MQSSVVKYNILISFLAVFLFIPFLGAVHLFDWDEINFAECAREMLVTHNYFSVTINFQPFWEKPPVFIWMQALSMSVFGINEFAARLPNAVCGVVTLLLLFNIGRKLYDIKFGLIWTLVYAGSFLPHFYFKSGIIDPWFNLFIFCGLYYFILLINYTTRVVNKKSLPFLLKSAFFIGMGILTKGPVAGLILGLCVLVYWIFKRFSPVIHLKQIILYALAVASIGGMWFLMLFLSGNASIINEFFSYQVRLFNTQDAGHGGPFLYHWIVLLVGCFPVSVFALQGFKRNPQDTPYQRYFKLWMMILFWVVLILFSIVKTKIVHYSSLSYFPLSFMGAYVVHKLVNGELGWKKITGILLLILATLLGVVISALPFVDRYKQRIINSNLIKDAFAVENLKATVYWTGYEWLIGAMLIAGACLMLYFVRKKKILTGISILFVSSLITVNAAAFIIAPRIEKYSQGAAIEFYISLQDKDCYIETLGFKSYAHLFYSRKKPQANQNSYAREWLLTGPIDKPAYFVSKITSVEEIKKNYPDLKELYRKNGFVFWKRNFL